MESANRRPLGVISDRAERGWICDLRGEPSDPHGSREFPNSLGRHLGFTAEFVSQFINLPSNGKLDAKY